LACIFILQGLACILADVRYNRNRRTSGTASMAHTIQTIEQLPLFLRALRRQRQLTQAGLAAQLGMSQQSYAQLEANPAVVSVERLLRVLQVLQVGLTLVPLSHHATPDPASVGPPAVQNGEGNGVPSGVPRGGRKPVAPQPDTDRMARIMREAW
jgi:HTH-type transcriptional regulator/antitoxin HipB